MPPTVSVIIPAYNAGLWIQRAIESCLAQTSQPLEIIVVDDGSSDDTAAIAASFSPSVQLVRQPNAGPAAARNQAARLAQGEWLGFLDADDYWFPDKLHVQLQPEISPDIAVLYTLFNTHNGSPEPPEVGFKELWDYNWIGISSTLVRRTAFEAVGGFRETLRAVEDYNLWLRLAAEGWRLVLCPHVLTYYEIGVGFSTDADRMLAASLLNIDDLEASSLIDRVLAAAKRLELYEEFACRALGARRMRQARQEFAKLFLRKPTLRLSLYVLASCLPPVLLDARRRLHAVLGDSKKSTRHQLP